MTVDKAQPVLQLMRNEIKVKEKNDKVRDNRESSLPFDYDVTFCA
jgi:hypothetical protein